MGTDPRDPGTDGDGIPDGAEVNQPELFPDADPLRTDIYVEVDTVEGMAVPDDALDRIEEQYADAPVDNPDGSTGISLHFVVSNTSLPDSDQFDESNWYDLRRDHFDNDGKGYHHLLLVDDAGLTGNGGPAAGLADGERAFMIVTQQRSERTTGSVVMHELGHSVGLWPADHDGIDSERYGAEAYPSVMNYNSAEDSYDYSTGDAGPNDFDDWGHIEEHLYVPNTGLIDVTGYEAAG
ncbi:hypothetical protein [Halolamina salifodinae]